MAMGSVWTFPATMRVAPNSPKALAKLRIVPAASPLQARGRETRKKA